MVYKMLAERQKHLKKQMLVGNEEGKRVCRVYIECDRSLQKTAKKVGMTVGAVKQLVSKSHYQSYIEWQAQQQERRVKLDYNYKMSKLKRVIDTFISDDDDLRAREVAVALQAIAESNKMAGHYSAEKVVNLNIEHDADLEQARDIASKMLTEYARDE